MPTSSKPTSVICVACLSGGSGKSTTVLNLATMLSAHGRTLAVDFDPQGDLTQWLGHKDLSQMATIAETLLSGTERIAVEEILLAPSNEDRGEGLMLAPADDSLANMAELIVGKVGREFFLKRALKSVGSQFDYIVIDSPPGKGILAYNALLAAGSVVIPVETTNKGVHAAHSTRTLINDLIEIEYTVPELLGILPTRDQWSGGRRTKMAKAAMEALEAENAGIRLFSPIVQSTIVTRANAAGLSLEEIGEEKLAQGYREIVDLLVKSHDA